MDKFITALVLCLAIPTYASPLTDCIDKLSQDNDRDKDITIISACVAFTEPRTVGWTLDKGCMRDITQTWANPMIEYYGKSYTIVIRKAAKIQCLIDCKDPEWKGDYVCR